MKKPLFLLSCLFFTCTLFSQSVISGKIIDSESKEPLVRASIFAQNTTRGTVSDSSGNFKIYLDKGGYELIISYTGYTNKTIRIESSKDQDLTILMQKADNSMSEIIIKSTNEVPDGWEKYGKFFIQHFIGATPFADSCTLENPQVLKFLYFKRTDRLKILASEPLIITNKALGYTLRYELDSFVHYYQKDISLYKGVCLYTPMDGDPQLQDLWRRNRLQIYYGSRLHFLRSYYDSTLKQEGFTVDILSAHVSNKFDRLVNPYDTSYYFFNDSTQNAELWFPAKVSITYSKKAPEKEYLQQYQLPLEVPVQISYIELTDAIVIKPNGYFFDQKSWINQGYWSWKNLADQLPYDYTP
jgi:hypothetical protein